MSFVYCCDELLQWTKCWKVKGMYLAQLLTFFITFFMTPGINVQGCDFPWFGPDCMFQCRCGVGARCDKEGACPGDSCQWDMFGPACQFRDAAVLSFDPSTPIFLRDVGVMSCNPDTASTYVEVKLKAFFPFKWYRIELKRHGVFDFSTTLNGDVRCVNDVIFVGPNFVDVICETNVTVNSLRITGGIAPHICAVRISKGRNVSYKQNATQSSVYPNGEAKNALKGDWIPVCSSSNPERRPWWRLDFTKPQLIYSVAITNRLDQQERLQGFTMQGLDITNVSVFQYTDSQPVRTDYEITWTSVTPVQTVLILAKDAGSLASGILTLCEVKVYADTVCPEGTYGLACELQCRCKDTELCNPASGACSPGCTIGFHGKNCSLPCGSNCLGGLCKRQGQCYGCIDGYLGDFCENSCETHTYGENCTQQCSKLCVDEVCNATSGECLSCPPDRSGLFCEACVTHQYGYNCTEQCSKFCVDEKCNGTSGECLSCLHERSGKFCEGCSGGYYGSYCDARCSEFCAGKTCNNQTGNCAECTHGYSGEKCDTNFDKATDASESSAFKSYWIVLMALLGLALVLCGSLFLCLKNDPLENEK